MSSPAAPKQAEQPEQKETPERRKARIEGIRKLIQLTSSPMREEATTAAFRACALIRKFALDVVDPVLIDEMHAENHRLRGLLEAAQQGRPVDDDDDYRAMNNPTWSQPYKYTPAGSKYSPAAKAPKGAGASIFGFGTQPPPSYQPPVAAPPTPPVNPSVVTPPKTATQSQPMKAPVLITSKFVGKCKQCGKVHVKDDKILWMKLASGGQAIWCPTTDCYHQWLHNTQAAANFNPFGP